MELKWIIFRKSVEKFNGTAQGVSMAKAILGDKDAGIPESLKAKLRKIAGAWERGWYNYNFTLQGK